MYNTSAEYKAAINSPQRELRLRLSLTIDGEMQTLTESDIEAGSLSITTQCMNKGFSLGGTSAADLSVSLNNRDRRWNDVRLDGAIVEPWCGIVLQDKTVYWVPMGVFIIDKPGRPYSTVNLKGADKMILLDQSLSITGITYPTTPRSLLTAIAQATGITIDPSTFQAPNIDKQILVQPSGKPSCRDAVAEIALLAGGYARMNRGGALEIVTLSRPDHAGAREMPVGSRKNFIKTSDVITITGMEYEGLEWGSMDYAVQIQRLNLLDPEKVETALAPVWEAIRGFTYTAYTSDYYGDPSLEAGDFVHHLTADQESVLSLITRHTYRHGRLSRMQADGKSASAQGYTSARSRELSQAVQAVEYELGRQMTAYEQGSLSLSQMMGQMLGVHFTEQTNEDGSKQYWFHNLPELGESQTIWHFDGQALRFSDDGGGTWSGIDASSNLVVKTIQTIGINAEWINLQHGNLASFVDDAGNRITEAETNITSISTEQIILSQTVGQLEDELVAIDGKYEGAITPIQESITNIRQGQIDLTTRVTNLDGEQGEVARIDESVATLRSDLIAVSEKQTAMEVGQGNLIMNPTYGTGDNVEEAFWATGLTWVEAQRRRITWGAVKAAGKTWDQAKRGDV